MDLFTIFSNPNKNNSYTDCYQKNSDSLEDFVKCVRNFEKNLKKEARIKKFNFIYLENEYLYCLKNTPAAECKEILSKKQIEYNI